MPRKKVLEEEHEEKVEWDKPRIMSFFIVLGLLVVGGLLGKHFFLDVQTNSSPQQSVQGISTQADASLPTVQSVQRGVTEQLANLQQQASQISVKDIASSSPQVQQILLQLQKLPQLPGDIAKQACVQLCGKL